MASLIDLKPDFAIALEDCEKESSYSSAITTLEKNGFYVQARPGDIANSVVLYVKLSADKLTELAQQDTIRCLQYGARSPLSLQADRFFLIDRYLTIDLGLVPRSGQWKYVTSIAPLPQQVFSLHTPGLLAFTNSESIADITKDYGVPVGLYFEFLQFYNYWLLGLSAFGVAFFVLYNKTFSYTFTFINMAWGILFLVFWNHKQSGFLKTWGGDKALAITLDQEEAQLKCKHASQYVRQLAFVPIALGAAAVLAGFQLLCFALEIFLTQIYNGPFQFALKLIPTITLQAFLPVFSVAYKLLAQAAIAREGQLCERRKVESMTIKLFVLNFLTNYMPLLITAFIYLPFGHFVEPYLPEIRSVISRQFSPDRFFYKYVVLIKSQKEYIVNQERLNEQYFFAMVAGQVITFTLKYVVPLVAARVIREVKGRLSKESTPRPVVAFAPGEKYFLKRVNHILRLPAYDVVDEYRCFVIQYGFLIMFGPVWPLAPLILALFNYINYKLDNFKLRTGIYAKYPVPQRAATMQLWMYVLYGLTWLGLIVLPLISAFYRHGTKLPKPSGQASINISSTAILIIVLFASEHFFFVSTYLLSQLMKAIDSDHTTKDEYSEKMNALKLKFAQSQLSSQKRSIPGDDSAWSVRSSDSALKQVNRILNGDSVGPVSHEHGSETENAHLTGSKVSDNQAVNRKLEKLEARKKELLEERAFLKQSEEHGDRIVEMTDATGSTHLSTIDNNNHAVMSSESVDRDSVAREARLSRTLDSSSSSLPLEAGDSKILSTHDDGNTVAATIDNNDHASLPSSAEDNVAVEATKSKTLPNDSTEKKGTQNKGKLKKSKLKK